MHSFVIPAKAGIQLVFMIAPKTALWLIALLVILRAVMSLMLPLTADEAYYWLWSQHLAAGYYDHPPAIAYLIRFGCAIFGENRFGVRFAGLILSLPATWFVFAAARQILNDRTRAMLAALIFNLALIMAADLMAATPDMPSIVTASAFLYCLAMVDRNPAWWLAAGAAAGLSLLSKYSALFLGAGALLWLVIARRQMLATLWPWAGAALAVLIFLPNLLWQSQNHWMTFAFQFGRVAQTGPFTLRYLFEFLGAQIGLITPLILVLAGFGFVRAVKNRDGLLLPAMLIAPALIYFLIHALNDRVQGNWTSFLCPAIASLAASGSWQSWCARLALPLAGLMLAVLYGQALLELAPRNREPVARVLGAGFPELADDIARGSSSEDGPTIVTTDYQTTAWLRFYQPQMPVVQVGETFRYPWGSAPVLTAPLYYLTEDKRDETSSLKPYFDIAAPRLVDTMRAGYPVSHYRLYPLSAPKGALPGKMP